MLQQVTAEVQLRLAAQDNSVVSLDITRMGNTWYHIISSLLLLLTYGKVHFAHLRYKKLQALAVFVKQYPQPDFQEVSCNSS